MYYKQSTGVLLAQKSTATPQWVKWIHETAGIIHCLSAYNWMGVGLHGTTHQFGPITKTATAVWKQSIT